MQYVEPSNVTLLAAHLAARGVAPHHAASFAEQLAKIARRLSQIAIADCNYGDDPGREKTKDAQRNKARDLMQQFAGWNPPAASADFYERARTDCFHGLSLSFGGDPRGYVVHVTGLPGNTWGGSEAGFGL